MDNYPGIFALCNADPAVVSLLGDSDFLRLYPAGQAPQDDAKPYAVFQVVGGNPENYVDRRTDIDRFTVQVDAYARSATQCRAVAAAIMDAIELSCHITGWFGDQYEQVTGLYRLTFQSDWFVPRRPSTLRAVGGLDDNNQEVDGTATRILNGFAELDDNNQDVDALGTLRLIGNASLDDTAQEVDATGTHASAFYFDQIANIRDFGVRNLANMRTVAGGGTLPVNNGDTVGEWRGELGNVVLQESSSTWRPKLGAEGVSFQSASSLKRLRSVSGISRSATLPCTVFVIQDLTASGYTDFISGNLRTSGTIQHGFSDAASGTSLTTMCREQSAGVTVSSGALNSGRHCYGYVWDGAACNVWADSTKVNRPSIGTGSGTSDIFELTNVGAQDGTVVAWGVVYGAISDADWAKIVALAATL